MHTIVLRGKSHKFEAYTQNEAKRLGIIDSSSREGTHAPVSEIFKQGEGELLLNEIKRLPDGVLVILRRNAIVIYRPKEVVK